MVKYKRRAAIPPILNISPDIAKALNDIYYRPEHRGSLGGVRRLFGAAREAGVNVSEAAVSAWLHSQPAYTIYHSQRTRFSRRSIDTFAPLYLWEVDLAEMPDDAHMNSGLRYILVCLDTFTKMLYVESLKTKTAGEVAEALERIFDRTGVQPENVSSDLGGEFTGQVVQDMFKRRKINSYQMQNPEIGAPMAERVIQTLKHRIVKHKEMYGGRYIDHLPAIVEGYNNNIHSTIGMAPADVNDSHHDLIRLRLEARARKRHAGLTHDFRFELWQIVRIRVQRETFHRGFHDQFSRGLYVVSKRLPTTPVTYVLHVFDHILQQPVPNSEIYGTYYEEELVAFVLTPPAYRATLQQQTTTTLQSENGTPLIVQK